jgi:hypothetical protein
MLSGDIMKRYYFTNYKNKSMLVLDFSNLSEKTAVKLLNESKLFISKQPKNSVLSLINITNLKYNTNTLNSFKEYVTYNEKYVLASAIYGTSFFQGIAIETFSRSTSMPIKICKTELEAKDWLAHMN